MYLFPVPDSHPCSIDDDLDFPHRHFTNTSIFGYIPTNYLWLFYQRSLDIHITRQCIGSTYSMTSRIAMESLPIPAFYCCYLLRSANGTTLYLGSTPNMRRRLRQHNGHVQGGAKRTSEQRWKPWEVTCIVQGFPSKIAALQFEYDYVCSKEKMMKADFE